MEKQKIGLQIEEDINEISRLIWDYFDKKYIGMLLNKVDGYRSQCNMNECKEAQLIQAIVPFLPDQRKMLGKVVDLLMYNQVVEKSIEDHESINTFFRDEDKDKEEIKKILFKIIMIKALMTIDQVKQQRS